MNNNIKEDRDTLNLKLVALTDLGMETKCLSTGNDVFLHYLYQYSWVKRNASDKLQFRYLFKDRVIANINLKVSMPNETEHSMQRKLNDMYRSRGAK